MTLHPSQEALVDFESLTGRRRRRVADHLAGCPRCRARLATLRSLRLGVAQVTHTNGAPDVWRNIEARLDDGPPVILPVPHEAGRPPGARSFPRRSVAAAVLSTLIAAGVAAAAVTLTPLGDLLLRDTAEAPADAYSDLAPEAGVELDVPAGGLTVELDVSDDVRLIVSFGEGERILLTTAPGTDQLALRVGASRVWVTGDVGTLQVRVPALGGPIRIVSEGVTLAVARGGAIRTARGEPSDSLQASMGTLRKAASRRDTP